MGRATAYDLSQFAPTEKEKPKVRVVRTGKKTKNKKQFKVQFIASVALLAALMTGTVYSRQELHQVKQKSLDAGKKLTEITSENAYLNYELESMVSLRNAEEYAEKELGLVRLESSQIEYVTLHDKNVIEVQEEDVNVISSQLQKLIDFLFGE